MAAVLYVRNPKFTLRIVTVLVLPILSICSLLALSAHFSGALSSATRVGVHPLLEIRHLAAACAMVLAAVVWKVCGWPLFSVLLAPFALVAPISYGLYIVHRPILSLYSTVEAFTGWFAMPLLACAIFGLASVLELWLYPSVKSAVLRRARTRVVVA